SSFLLLSFSIILPYLIVDLKLCNRTRNYYEQYIAASGARVYKENRENSHARDHNKYSAAFLAALPENLAPKKGLRIHSVDTFVHSYRKLHPDERLQEELADLQAA
ncbi:hypothetical protein QJS79_13590, partial [Enterococcus faecium]